MEHVVVVVVVTLSKLGAHTRKRREPDRLADRTCSAPRRSLNEPTRYRASPIAIGEQIDRVVERATDRSICSRAARALAIRLFALDQSRLTSRLVDTTTPQRVISIDFLTKLHSLQFRERAEICR